MNEEEIIQKVKVAERIANNSEEFKKIAFRVILSYLLGTAEPVVKVINSKKIWLRGRKRNYRKTTTDCASKIDELINGTFFDSPKTNKEIIDKLRLIGYNMSPTSLPSYLIPRVQSGKLTRKKTQTPSGEVFDYTKADRK